ncbi:MAG: glutamine--fructose-6-phosphate aminotransferase [Elusimicrobia bacterium GWA2_56_46]|nr:MAG: glutamine--fructose-6-phosphate aminotransferase [Elusimicrobia bacterium GWA2_56_46]OGR54345.1 MAG: glutamine--fructose-6-phosphate aminotransferase [Elusimicrobia bacterium GWC2_56_31]HBW22804.1 glutamine--fructose-6-phosphate transaminase (isomerizing) [Elusimicrobiota bacterium]
MCGITGYIGEKTATDILVDGLKRLEYRGYDSCGVAGINPEKGLYLKRVSGRVDALDALIAKDPLKKGTVGIGHTRWATHGVPSEDNAHPHTDCKNEVVLVHNGIIENYLEIKEQLLRTGHKFKSETDTEAVVHLIEEKIKGLNVSGAAARSDVLEPMFFEAVRRAIAELKGSFAMAVLWARCPGMLLAARQHSPLVIGLGGGENFIASDVSAFLKYTKKAVFLNDGEMAAVKKDSVLYFNFQGKKVEHSPVTIQWDSTMAEKGGYKHFMLKEIHEQPESVENTLRGRLLPLKGDILQREINLPSELIRNIKGVQIIACGTAYHAGLVGRYVFENFGLPTSVDFASEFSDRAKIVNKDILIIAVSQSGETADTLYAVREAKASGAKVLAITNTLGSTLTREADYVLYTHCGPEIGVASTKAFIGQLAAMYVLAIHFAVIRKNIFDADAREYANELLKIPRLIEAALEGSDAVLKIAEHFAKSEHFLFIARHINFPIALEGALKIKEISYVHAEGYAAGEMKHGPIAIIYKGMPVLAVATTSKMLSLVANNIEEAKARGAEVTAIVDEDSRKLIKASHYITVPRTAEILSPLLTVIPLQLFAYFIALAKKCDIDKPRNLAKSVTVR